MSEYTFRQILANLSAFSVDSALRQIEVHRAAGDFAAADCDRLARVVSSGRAWMAL